MAKPTTWLVISATRADAARLIGAGPKRDFEELRKSTGGTYVFQDGPRQGRSLRQRILGPHVRQAWKAASLARNGDTLFADGEHIGVPLAIFLRLRNRKPARLVMLAHWITPRWKRVALRAASLVGVPATVVVHGVVQRDAAKDLLGRRWQVVLVPYLVDTDFWTSGPANTPGEIPFTVVAAGSENRDYATLLHAAELLPEAAFVIAAGSHWARSVSSSGSALPANVTFISETLDFNQLRELYRSATVVAVPLFDVDNQSGVTAILEGMSMARPVVTTASQGQQEVLRGPLVRESGELDSGATAPRGPQQFDPSWAGPVTGYYAEVGSAPSFAAALRLAHNDPSSGIAGRATTEAHFRIDQFVERLTNVFTLPVTSKPAVGSGRRLLRRAKESGGG